MNATRKHGTPLTVKCQRAFEEAICLGKFTTCNCNYGSHCISTCRDIEECTQESGTPPQNCHLNCEKLCSCPAPPPPAPPPPRPEYSTAPPPSPPPPPSPAPSPATSCEDSCSGISLLGITGDYTSDGDCDDGGPGAVYSACRIGTDCADCGARSTNESSTNDPSTDTTSTSTLLTRLACLLSSEDSCEYSFDGTCDEGGTFAYCRTGTDCTDCHPSASPPPTSTSGLACLSSDNSCEHSYDGVCDEGGWFPDCRDGTDCTDCQQSGSTSTSTSVSACSNLGVAILTAVLLHHLA